MTRFMRWNRHATPLVVQVDSNGRQLPTPILARPQGDFSTPSVPWSFMKSAPWVERARLSRIPVSYRDKTLSSTELGHPSQHPYNGRQYRTFLKGRKQPKKSRKVWNGGTIKGCLSSVCEDASATTLDYRWLFAGFRWAMQRRWVRWPLAFLAVLISCCTRVAVRVVFTAIALWGATFLLLFLNSLGSVVRIAVRTRGRLFASLPEARSCFQYTRFLVTATTAGTSVKGQSKAARSLNVSILSSIQELDDRQPDLQWFKVKSTFGVSDRPNHMRIVALTAGHASVTGPLTGTRLIDSAVGWISPLLEDVKAKHATVPAIDLEDDPSGLTSFPCLLFRQQDPELNILQHVCSPASTEATVTIPPPDMSSWPDADGQRTATAATMTAAVASNSEATPTVGARAESHLRKVLGLVLGRMTRGAFKSIFDVLLHMLAIILKLCVEALMHIGLYCAKVLLTTFLVVSSTLLIVWVILFLLFEKPGMERIFCTSSLSKSVKGANPVRTVFWPLVKTSEYIYRTRDSLLVIN
ncbi:hypothetical protein BKA70DRAFT_1215081 [Coprinopsis sp. MPI-PUGE-AT-0042]|nr:hypothetical protein BKA70DRAFT_1215081 [Coprinopsis sp. MPI-PUGE-AT-0042]